MAGVDSEWEKLLKQSQPSLFSDEIMFEILSRLPVKSIIRFKCVRKKWSELFGDSNFIAAHLKLSVEVSNYFGRESFYKRDNDLRAGFYLSNENYEELREFPFETDWLFIYGMVGSVDGLVCIHKIDIRSPKPYLLLWNPATRESRNIPAWAGLSNVFHPLGFGFDPKNNDYKVVMLISFENAKRVDVYSLKNDRWRNSRKKKHVRIRWRSFKVEDFDVLQIHGEYVNGRLHWLSSGFIVSFDLTDEKIIRIGMPDNLNYSRIVCLKVTGKSLTVAVGNDEGETEVWLMKKYGDSKSWSKLYNIPPHPLYGSIKQDRCHFLVNGKVIMRCHDHYNMISYDPKNQEFEILPVEGSAYIIRYKESFVSV